MEQAPGKCNFEANCTRRPNCSTSNTASSSLYSSLIWRPVNGLNCSSEQHSSCSLVSESTLHWQSTQIKSLPMGLLMPKFLIFDIRHQNWVISNLCPISELCCIRLVQSTHLYPVFGLQVCSTSIPPSAGAPYTAADGHETPLAQCSVNRQDQAFRPEYI